MIGRHLSRIKLWAKRSREGGIEKLPTRDHGGGSKRKMTGKTDTELTEKFRTGEFPTAG